GSAPDSGPAATAGDPTPTITRPTANARAIFRAARRGVEAEPLAIGRPPRMPAFDRNRSPSSRGNAGEPDRTIMLQIGRKSDRYCMVTELSAPTGQWPPCETRAATARGPATRSVASGQVAHSAPGSRLARPTPAAWPRAVRRQPALQLTGPRLGSPAS